MKKNIKILILTLCLTVLSAVFFSAYATEIIESGECGENLTWTFDSEGTLTISGTGDMTNYRYQSYVPWYNIRETIKKIIVNENVTSLSDYSFTGSTLLTEVILPESMETIGNSIFSNCSQLQKINLPDNISSIGTSAFLSCSQLKEISLPSSIKEIKTSTFRNSGLTKIKIKEGVTKIGSYAFYNCTALTSVDIPSTLTSIEAVAFSGCSTLNTVNIADVASWCGVSIAQNNSNPLYYTKNLCLNGEIITDLIIPETVTSISAYAFMNSSIKSVSIPKSLTSIGKDAFSDCSSLNAVYITDLEAWCKISFKQHNANPMYYASYLYLNKEKIDDLVIPESITHLGDYVFYNGSFNSVTIPKTLKSVGSQTFACKTLKNVYISDLEAWCEIDFYHPQSNPLNTGGFYSYMSDGGYLYLNGNLIKDLIIPETVTNIMPSTFTGIRVDSITIPNSVVHIGNNAFSSCYTLKEIVIPENVKTIGDYAFYNSPYLASVTLPAGLESIGEMAFKSYYSELSDVYYKGTEAQWNMISIGDYNSDFDNATIHYLGETSGETMLDENFQEVPIPEDALIVAIFRKNATGNIIEEEAYGINFDGTNYPGAVEVPKDGIWVIKLVDPYQNILTVGKSYTYSVFTNGATIDENLTYTVK